MRQLNFYETKSLIETWFHHGCFFLLTFLKNFLEIFGYVDSEKILTSQLRQNAHYSLLRDSDIQLGRQPVLRFSFT